MPTKKKADTEKRYTYEEAMAEHARRKEEAKKAKESAKKRVGYVPGVVDATGKEYNRLAAGAWSDGNGTLTTVSASMADAGGRVTVNLYPHGLWARGLYVKADSVEEACAAMADMLAKYAEAMLATGRDSIHDGLARDYVKAAKEHTYNPPKKKEQE